MPLSLRRGVVTAVHERHEGLARVEVDGWGLRGVPAADRPGRDRRRGRRQHAGARPRARLRRVRRAVREPDARARLAGRLWGTRHEASVYAAAVRRSARGGGVFRQIAARGHACGVLFRSRPGPARVRGAQRAPRRLPPARGRSARAGALRRPTYADRVLSVRRCLLRRRRRVRQPVVGARVGEIGGTRCRRLLGRARHRGHRLPARARRARRRHRCERGDRPRGAGSGRGSRFGGRRARAPPGPFTPHAGRARRLGDVVVADEADGDGWRQACEGLPLSHMERGPDEDPAFFAAAYAAGVSARRLLG